MKRSKEIHLEGEIRYVNGDGIKLNDDYNNLANTIANSLEGTDSGFANDDTTVSSLYCGKVFFRFYVTDEKISLEELKKKEILKIVGALDIHETWYGYSEWTIEGYSVEHFMIGGHDIEKELKQYTGKYVHILIDAEGK